ncbi:uncharacterized protein V6R79_015438 [Siganus canaliculatus]
MLRPGAGFGPGAKRGLIRSRRRTPLNETPGRRLGAIRLGSDFSTAPSSHWRKIHHAVLLFTWKAPSQTETSALSLLGLQPRWGRRRDEEEELRYYWSLF